MLLKPWIVSFFDNQGQFWKPQNLRKRINIKLIVILLFHWVEIEIQKWKVTEVSVLWVIWDTVPTIFGQESFKMAFGLVYLKSPWNDSSKTPLACSFLITRMQFRDISEKLFQIIINIILEGKIHFERFPSLSLFPSQGHNSGNLSSNLLSKDSFGN